MTKRGSSPSVLAAVACVVSLLGLCAPSADAATPAGGDDPIGNLEGPSVRLSQLSNAYTYELYGWAADPSSPGQPVWVRLYVDGQFDRDIVTGDARPDVAAAYPFAGPNAGFSALIRSNTSNGLQPDSTPKTVCAYALNTGAGSTNTTLGCVGLPVPGADGHEPIGSIDEVRVSPGLVHLRGWAGDRDAGDQTVEVRVYYDDTPELSMFADRSRPDVPVVFAQLDATTGFDQDLPMFPGRHNVCAFASNLGKGGLQNTTLGCVTVDVPGPVPAGPRDPQGNQERIDEVPHSARGGPTHFVGWAFDPDTSGPWTVRVLSVRDNTCCPRTTDPVHSTTGVTNQPRPDVQAAFPAAGPNAGYDIESQEGIAYSQVRFACAYAHQEGSGAPERFIGCSNRST